MRNAVFTYLFFFQRTSHIFARKVSITLPRFTYKLHFFHCWKSAAFDLHQIIIIIRGDPIAAHIKKPNKYITKSRTEKFSPQHFTMQRILPEVFVAIQKGEAFACNSSP